MAKFWMLTTVSIAAGIFRAGRPIDDTVDPYAAIVAQGGAGCLIPQGNPVVDTAALLAQTAHTQRALSDAELIVMMNLAVDAADTSLSETSSQTVYVNKGGSDATGTGTLTQPFLTIQKALTSITDATTNKRYFILVGPGNYADPFQIKPWVYIQAFPALKPAVGLPSVTSITAGADTCGIDPSWATAPGGFGAAGFRELVFFNHQTFDYTTAPGISVILYFFDCEMAGGYLFNGRGQEVGTAAYFYGGLLSGTQVFSNIHTAYMDGVWTSGGSIAVNANASGATQDSFLGISRSAIGTNFPSFGGATPITILAAAPSTRSAKLFLANNAPLLSGITLNGANTLLTGALGTGNPAVTLTNSAPAPLLSSGTATIDGSTGKSPTISANFTASSNIICTVKTPANDALTAKGYSALSADRSPGSPGTFKISALAAGGSGATNTADTSVVEWHID